MEEEDRLKPMTETAILAAVDTGEYDADSSLNELEELARTAGAEVIGRLVQKRESPDTATCIGAGRLEEFAGLAANTACDLVIFDRELTATQQRNLEDALPCRVVDRTLLILDIFAGRARSSEGRLQVELAQLQYLLPRLAGQGTALSRLGGGIGTRGPGETKLESDRRHIRRRIKNLKLQLAEVQRQRETRRARRQKIGLPTVALVGYTNAGKSTLLNALTDAGVLAEDKLFATLDPTARAAGAAYRHGRLGPSAAPPFGGRVPLHPGRSREGRCAAESLRRIQPRGGGASARDAGAAGLPRLYRPPNPDGV